MRFDGKVVMVTGAVTRLALPTALSASGAAATAGGRSSRGPRSA